MADRLPLRPDAPHARRLHRGVPLAGDRVAVLHRPPLLHDGHIRRPPHAHGRAPDRAGGGHTGRAPSDRGRVAVAARRALRRQRRPDLSTPTRSQTPSTVESAKPISEITCSPRTCGPPVAKMPMRLEPIRPPATTSAITRRLNAT